MQYEKHTNRAENMIDTRREYGRCMYNGIKSMFGFGVSEGGTSKRQSFDKLSWKICYWNLKRNICISRGNRTINSLSHKDFVHLSEAGSHVWVFDHLNRSGGDGGLGPLYHLTDTLHDNFLYVRLFYF